MTRVAVVAPHPDDEVLGCTSVLVEHEVIVVHVTDGVPVGVDPAEATGLARAREQEARRAWELLGARVTHFVTLDGRDQEVWCQTTEIARRLAEVVAASDVTEVYVTALQSGHPDHDGVYVAAQLARSMLGDSPARWYCYALYALDDQGRPGYGWLHPGLFPDVTDRAFTTEEIERKTRALRAFSTQVGPDSVVQRWIDGPTGERFAPLPPRDAPFPLLRSYYDEVFRFGESGIERGTVERILRAVLAGDDP